MMLKGVCGLMADYKLSRLASKDLDTIYEYGIITFGHRQAEGYILALEKTLSKLASVPTIGRKSDLNIGNLYQFPYKSHTIFYKKGEGKVYILRILGARMDFNSHL